MVFGGGLVSGTLPCAVCGVPVVATPDELCWHCEQAELAEEARVRDLLEPDGWERVPCDDPVWADQRGGDA